MDGAKMDPLRILTILIALNTAGSDIINNKYKIFSGFHFEERSDLIAYESVIPMMFKMTLFTKPNLLPKENNTFCKDTAVNGSTDCNSYNNLYTLQNMIQDQIETNFMDLSLGNVTTTSRKRRGLIFLQDFLEWCCNVANVKQVSNIYENQKDLETHANQIIDSVGTQYKDLVSTTKNLNNFTGNIQNLSDRVHLGLKVIRNELNNIRQTSASNVLKQLYALIEETWTYIIINYLQDKNREILEKCHLNILSEHTVKPQDLFEQLKTLETKANKKGIRLAIPSVNQNLYYRLKLTSCKIFNNTLLVRLNVPLINLNLKGKFFKAIPTPVVWEQMICNLQIKEVYIYKTANYSKLMETSKDTCSEHSYPLCNLPRQTQTTEKQHKCLHNILSSESINNLQKSCHYECSERTQFPIITELLPNKFLITNIGTPLQIVCGKEEITTEEIMPIEAGTIEIDVPCDCEINLDNNTLITKTMPCDAKDIEKPRSVSLIPATWSKLKTIKLFSLESRIHHEFDNLSEIIDANWTLNNPTFHVTALKKIEQIKLKNNAFDIFNDTQLMLYIIIAWVAVLTITCLVIIYCVHIQGIKITFLLPERDYNEAPAGTRR